MCCGDITVIKKQPVPVSSEMEMSIMKNKIAELRAQVNQHSCRERSSSTSGGEGFNIVSYMILAM